jgi:hypothetical protein
MRSFRYVMVFMFTAGLAIGCGVDAPKAVTMPTDESKAKVPDLGGPKDKPKLPAPPDPGKPPK